MTDLIETFQAWFGLFWAAGMVGAVGVILLYVFAFWMFWARRR